MPDFVAAPNPPAPTAGAGLPVLELRLDFAGDSLGSQEHFGGDIWRSAFGLHLRRQVCVTGAATCEGCPLRARCAYAQIFESVADASQSRWLREGAETPNPYVLSPRPDADAGPLTRVHVLLIGRVRTHAALVVRALESAAAAGLGRARRPLGLQQVMRVDPLGHAQPWVATAASQDTAAREPPPPPPGVTVYLETPLCLRVRGRELDPSTFSFELFVAALLRRITLLQESAGESARAPDAATVAFLRQAARSLELSRVELHWQAQRRWSSRQRRAVPMGGLVGSFTLRGEGLAPLWPWLWLGQRLHVGRGTVMGQGRYRMEAQSLPQTWLVSRHAGAAEFLRAQGWRFDRHVVHLDGEEGPRPGDTVVGTLPLHRAARLCQAGVRLLHLAVDVPEDWRGQELDALQLTALGARLEEIVVRTASCSGGAPD